MSWLYSLLISALSGVVGLLCAGGIAALCVEWYRISSFEGKSGYFVGFTALLGGLVSVAIGLIAARWVAGGVAPGFLKALGVACGSVLGLGLVTLTLCRLLADLPPTQGGKALVLELEVRCPRHFTVPAPDDYGATAEVYVPGGRRQPSDALRVNEINAVEEQLTVPATVPLTTSSAKKFLQVRFNAQLNLIFPLPLPSHPHAGDHEWSRWIESGWNTSQPEPPKDARFNLRFRVRAVEPEPPPPDPATARAQEFAALKPDASLDQLLPFLFKGPTPESTAVVTKAIAERQTELAALIRSPNETTREFAMRAVTYAPQPPPELVEAVLAEGRAIAAVISQFNARSPADPNHNDAPELRSRFSDWRDAWWTIQQQLGVDGRPPVQQIHDLATVRAPGTAMSDIEASARMMLDQLNQDAAAGRKP
jgi:hypothetical protein